MIRSLTRSHEQAGFIRIAAIFVFIALITLSARVSIEFGNAVPFTLQTMVVLLTGMVLGSLDGGIAMMSYVALIAIGLPLDARALGTVSLFGPTGGYLIGFIVATIATGFICEKSGNRFWMRCLAGIVGAFTIYLVGVPHLKLYTGMDWSAAWIAGAAPFIAVDIVKALIAAGLAESGKSILERIRLS
ncbi:biotin transporter BioY [Anaerolineales bacterium]